MKRLAWAALALFAAAPTAFAAVGTFNVTLTGQKELDAGRATADLDGSAIGTVTLDGDAGTFTWNFILSNIAPPTDFHIHGPAGPAQQASVFIPFGVPAGSLVGNTFASTVNANAANLNTVLANPGNFYLNIHNADFTGGAVRNQVPEPAGLSLLALAGVAMLRRRKA